MRKILSRGKRKDTGEWVYWTCMGKLHQTQRGKLMSGTNGLTDWAYELLSIDDDTIGQYIEQKDKHGEYVFEGDVLRVTFLVGEYDFETKAFSDGLVTIVGELRIGPFGPEVVTAAKTISLFEIFLDPIAELELEVIGNIYDNPELMEEASHAAD